MTVRMEPAFDTRAFRRALGHFPTGVCVVTSRVDGALVGMTVNSFNSLSLAPPLVLFSVDANAASLPLWRRAEGYAVNVLAENQKDMSDRFARSGGKKGEGTTYADGLFGAPILPGVAATLECAAWATHAAGDHVLFIAEVRRFRTASGRRPLVFSNGRHAKLHETEFAASLWPLDIHY
jgi:flavin reductase (DIM6/NTAB) family NADH-FMN oxidoreductase RutF